MWQTPITTVGFPQQKEASFYLQAGFGLDFCTVCRIPFSRGWLILLPAPFPKPPPPQPNAIEWSEGWYLSFGRATEARDGPNRGWMSVSEGSAGSRPASYSFSTELYLASLSDIFQLIHSTWWSTPRNCWDKTGPGLCSMGQFAA